MPLQFFETHLSKKTESLWDGKNERWGLREVMKNGEEVSKSGDIFEPYPHLSR